VNDVVVPPLVFVGMASKPPGARLAKQVIKDRLTYADFTMLAKCLPEEIVPKWDFGAGCERCRRSRRWWNGEDSLEVAGATRHGVNP
jgi:hypothetical protein